MKVDLTGKTAVVTGGGGILCSVMARALAASGAKVAILDLKEEAAVKVADEIIADGGKAIGVSANVLDLESLKKAEAAVKEAFGDCDILVNGAGGNNPKGTTSKEFLCPEDLKNHVEGLKTFFDLDPAGVGFVFNLNFLGTLLPTQVFARAMAEKGCGSIINISSMNAFTPLTKIPAYSAAKGSINNFTQWYAVHVAELGIRCNAIAPGFFLTDQNRFLLTDEQTGELKPRGKKIIANTPTHKFGEPEDLVGTMLYLLSDISSFVTGIVIPVDGGYSAFGGV